MPLLGLTWEDYFLALLVQARQEQEKQYQELRRCHLVSLIDEIDKGFVVMLEVMEVQVKGFGKFADLDG